MEIGGAMGWTPGDVRAASLRDLLTCWRGYLRAQGVDPEKPAAAVKRFDRADLDALKAHYKVH